VFDTTGAIVLRCGVGCPGGGRISIPPSSSPPEHARSCARRPLATARFGFAGPAGILETVRPATWLVLLALGCAPESVPTVDPGPSPRTDLVALADAGAEPRQVFNYDPELGAALFIGVQLDARRTQTIDGETRNSGTPEVLHIQYRVNDVDREWFSVSGRLLAVDGPRRGITAHDLLDIRAWTIFDHGGNPTESSVDNTGTRGDRLERLMHGLNQLRAPLPASQIGTGARWSTRETTFLDDMALMGSTHYELQRIEGTVLTIAAQTTFDEPGSDFIPPGLVRGTQFTLRQFSASTRATLQIDLARPGWSNSASQTDLRVVYTTPSQDVSPLPHKIS